MPCQSNKLFIYSSFIKIKKYFFETLRHKYFKVQRTLVIDGEI